MTYSLNGAYPTKLPERIRLPDGSTRTDSSTFTAEEIALAGYSLAPEKPSATDLEVVEWSFGGWVVRPMTTEEYNGRQKLMVEAVKEEAYRRIIAICPEWRQRNLTAQAAQLAKKGEANWTPEEQAAWDAGEALWNQIAAIRAKSDLLEAMDPIPVDYALDTYWT
jgi:hypothetical protein